MKPILKAKEYPYLIDIQKVKGFKHYAHFPFFARNIPLFSTDFVACSNAPEVPVIAFVSKMIAMPRKALPQNRPRFAIML